MAIVSMLYGAGGASSADEVSYDNTTSGLEAENVQDAVDEINGKLQRKAVNVTHIIDNLTQDGLTYNNGMVTGVLIGGISVATGQQIIHVCTVDVPPFQRTAFLATCPVIYNNKISYTNGYIDTDGKIYINPEDSWSGGGGTQRWFIMNVVYIARD